MKKIIPIAVAILAALLFLFFYKFTPVFAVMDDGYALTEDIGADLLEAEGKDRTELWTLTPIKYEDTLYERGGKYYIGEGNRKQQIYLNYPLYVLDGGGLRFMNGQFYTVTGDFEFLPTYDGLYLIDGYTYNLDKSQADPDAFYFVTLPNGLFVNALPMTVRTNLETKELTANSILALDDTEIRLYRYEEGVLCYDKVTSMSQAKVEIDGVTYDYRELLRLLRLVQEYTARVPGVPGALPPEVLAPLESDAGSGRGGSRRNSDQAADTEVVPDPEEAELQAGDTEGVNQGLVENGSAEREREDVNVNGEDGRSLSSGGGSDGGGGGGNSETIKSEGGGGSAGGGNTPPSDISTPSDVPDPLPIRRYVRIKKENSAGEPLQGAEFTLYKWESERPNPSKDPVLATKLTTDKEGEFYLNELGYGSYYLKETKAPAGYRLPGNNVTFKVEEDVPEVDITIKNYRPDEIDDGGGEDPGGPGDGGGILDPDGDGSGELEYEPPSVSVEEWEPWAYALHNRLKIQDPNGYISRGVRFTVYRVNTNILGQETYSTVCRQTINDEGEINLAIVPPNTELAIEGTYRYYYYERNEDGTSSTRLETARFLERETTRVRSLPIEGNVYPVKLPFEDPDMNDLYSNRVEVKGLTIHNTADYDPEKKDYENFKKNTLPYVSRVAIQTSTDGGATFTDSGRMGNAAFRELIAGNPVDYISDAVLTSQTNYICRLVAYDKYGNQIPVEETGRMWETRTCKITPAVEGRLTGNTTGLVSMELTVTDPDHALLPSAEGVAFYILYNGQKTPISGTLDGNEFNRQEEIALTLGTHQLTITNLLFSRKYVWEGAADYNLNDKRGSQQDAVISTGNFLTAPIVNGSMYLENEITDIAGTGATSVLRVTERSSAEVLPMLTSLEVIARPESGDGEASVRVNIDDLLEKTLEDYDETRGGWLIKEPNEATGQVGIEILGEKPAEPPEGGGEAPQFNLWNSFLNGQFNLKVVFPKNSLQQSTKYLLTVRSLIETSGEEYEIPTSVNNSAFSTLKREPEVEIGDLLLVNDSIDFYGLQILDEDGAIINRNVRVYLKDPEANVTLGSKSLKSGEIYDDLTFYNLVKHREYILEFVALEYNLGSTFSTYDTNVVIDTFEFVAGSSLNGGLSLMDLKQGGAAGGEYMDNGTVQDGLLADNGTIQADNEYKTSDYMEYDEDDTYLFSGLVDSIEGLPVYVAFYNEDREFIRHVTLPSQNEDYAYSPVKGNKVDGAKYFRYSFPASNGNWARIKHYTQVQDNVITEEMLAEGYSYSYDSGGAKVASTDLIPVQGGGVYLRNGVTSWISYYNRDKVYMGRSSSCKPEDFVRVPSDCAYIAISISNGNRQDMELYQLGDGQPATGYLADINVHLEDSGNFLESEPEYQLRLSWSDSYRNIKYVPTDEDIREDFDGTGEPVKMMDKVHSFTSLEPDAAYQLELIVTYLDRELVLDTLSFQTNEIYDIIQKEADLQKVVQNPDGNYLVTNDIEITRTWNISLNGRVDFNGHTITSQRSYALFNSISSTGAVENLCVDIVTDDSRANNNFRLVYTCNGEITNLIYRVSGVESSKSSLIYTCGATGKIKNVAILIDKSVTINSGGLFINNHTGLLDSVYYHIAPGEKVLVGKFEYPNNPSYCGLLTNDGYGGRVQNIYGVGDFYYWIKNTWNPSIVRADVGQVSNFYIRGEFWGVSEDGSEALGSSQRMVSGGGTNIKYVSENTYSGAVQAGYINLYDIAWQKNMLGKGNFDIEEPVSMGYYPRLKFPPSMQGKQPYLELPLVEPGNAIRIIESKVLEETGSMVRVEMTLENARAYRISGLEVQDVDATVSPEQTHLNGVTTIQVVLNRPQTYVSSYTVNRIRYNNGSTEQTAVTSFPLKARFYKDVSTVVDWADMKNNPHWNYRLKNDIDFTYTSNPDYMEINRSFSGTIDGAEYSADGTPTGRLFTVRGMRMERKDPCFFTNITESGTIKNLIIEDLTLVGREGSQSAAFIRTNRGTLQNVHLRNSNISGSGNVGGLIANAATCTVQNCSVADTVLRDLERSVQVLSMGAIAAEQSGKLNIQNCYVRGVELNANYSPSAKGIGGLVGSTVNANYGMQIENCYADGTINSTLNNVGGIVGSMSHPSIRLIRCWSQVVINTKGSVTGGIAGQHISGSVNTVLALGAINSSGSDIYRISATQSEKAYSTRAHAYERQMFNGEPAGRMDATMLVTTEELLDPMYWQDKLIFGSSFDYEPLAENLLPKVYEYGSETTLVYGQEDIMIQGLGYDVSLESAVYNPNEGGYNATFKVVHENVSSSDLEFQITIDGIGEDGIPFTVGNGLNVGSLGENTTSLQVSTEMYYKAFDSYQATVSIRRNGSSSWQRFGLSVTYLQNGEPYVTYWDIRNLTDWNEKMAVHGLNQENYKIHGMINIGGRPDYTGLRVNRLEGVNQESCGFTNIRQTSMQDGNQVWIEMAGIVKNLKFTNFMLNFSNPQSAARSSTGLIAFAFSVENVTIGPENENSPSQIIINRGATQNVGFFGKVQGNIKNAHVSGMQIGFTGVASTASDISNVGLLCGYLEGVVTNSSVTGTETLHNKITLVGEGDRKGTNIGGMIGNHSLVYAETAGLNNENLTVTYTDIIGGSSIGGVFGIRSNGSIPNRNITVDHVTLKANSGSMGGVFGAVWYGGNAEVSEADVRNVTIDCNLFYTNSNGGIVLSGGNLGGITGSSSWTSVLNSTVRSVTITGPGVTGGIAGSSARVENCTVQDVQITVRSGNQADEDAGIETNGSNVGGITGTLRVDGSIRGCRVINSQIKGVRRVGGIVGSVGDLIYNNTGITNCYVDEETTVEGALSVGGAAGQVLRTPITGFACGADVTATKEEAGGIIGSLYMADMNRNNQSINNIYFVGNVQAANYAGGIVGRVREYAEAKEPTTVILPDRKQQIIVAGDISVTNNLAPHVSIWANGERVTTNIGQMGRLRIFADSKIIIGGGTPITGEGLKDYFPTGFSQTQKDAGMEAMLVDTAMLSDPEFYRGKAYTDGQIGFTAANWDYAKLSAGKMPYVMYNSIPVTVDPGISIPQGTTQLQAAFASELTMCQIYPSGADTINLELDPVFGDQTGWSLSVTNGTQELARTEITQETYTLEYDYKTPLSVAVENGTERYEMTVDPTPLRRTVMTWEDDYYYLTNTGVRSAEDAWEGEYIHLMDGKALSVSGELVDLADGGTDTLECAFQFKEEPKVFASGWAGDALVQAYGTYSTLENDQNSVRRDSRILIQDGQVYSLHVGNPLYGDSFILDSYQEDAYFTVVADGRLEHFQTPLRAPEGVRETGISHMTNNLNCNRPWVLIRYKNGSVTGFNYITGESLGELESLDMGEVEKAEGFLDYAGGQLGEIIGGFLDGIRTETEGTSGFYSANSFMGTLKTAVAQDSTLRAQLNNSEWTNGSSELAGSAEADGLDAEAADAGFGSGTDAGEEADAEDAGAEDSAESGGAGAEDSAKAGGEAADKQDADAEKTGGSGAGAGNKSGAGAGGAGKADAGVGAGGAGKADVGAGEAGKAGAGAGEAGKADAGGAGEADASAGAGGAGKGDAGAGAGGAGKADAGAGEAGKADAGGSAAEAGGVGGNNPVGASAGTVSGTAGIEAADSAGSGKDGKESKGETALADKSGRSVLSEQEVKKEGYMVAYNKAAGDYQVYNMNDYLDPSKDLLLSENQKLKELENQGIKINLDSVVHSQAETQESGRGMALLLSLLAIVSGLSLVLYKKGRK